MAKKIDGYCQKHDNQDYLDRGNTVFVNRTPCTGKDPRCTVVVHGGKAERVFTESDVREMLRDVIDRTHGDSGTSYAVLETAENWSIVLDPA